MNKEILKEKILKKEAKIGIIGLGYVGLPLAVEIAKANYRVIGFDISERKISLLKNGFSYIQDVSSEEIKELIKEGKFYPETNMDLLSEVDSVSICVPTPLNKTRDPNISYILNAIEILKKYVHPGMLIILESTTYPGTTREILLPALSQSLQVGKDIFIAFSPERIDPGNKIYTLRNTPKIVGGITKDCTELAKLLYEQFVEKVISVSSPEAAEMAKLLENTFRAVNIGLVNEIAIMCNKLGLDTWEVIEAAATKPFGFMRFNPGPGLGGHCIPIDPLYLSWKLKTLNYTARFIELASEINSHMPEFVVGKIADCLNEKSKSINSSKILIIGVSYKKDTADIRESPALDIIKLLQAKGAILDYYDPYIPSFKVDDILYHSIQFEKISFPFYDIAIIVTDHSCIDYQHLVNNLSLILDCRNATKGLSGKAKIVKL